eukprot:TRINITY_DN2537_c0_g1_i3.p1 TRINITY_DN2537_c0_g1~~TRINITY_DN2537_c0_g1_i3.p1  ORF type:complete len:272 (-),score=48.60 TRINITY_DN2537_c0_g1_i3:106-921(-)
MCIRDRLMVILSIAICDKSGKLLLARQFHDFTKQELEEKIMNFPKQISSLQQHTFIEANNVRYVYMPLNNLYLLLLTNKNSNILEDLETLKLVHNIIRTACLEEVDEEVLMENQFEILLMIDDILTSYGLRINITVNQLKNSLEMESAEEKLEIMQRKARENQAKEDAQKHALEIQKKIAEGKPGTSSVYMGIAGGSSAQKEKGQAKIDDTKISSVKMTTEFDRVGQLEQSNEAALDYAESRIKETAPAAVTKKTNAPKRGLVLGKKKPKE